MDLGAEPGTSQNLSLLLGEARLCSPAQQVALRMKRGMEEWAPNKESDNTRHPPCRADQERECGFQRQTGLGSGLLSPIASVLCASGTLT